MTAPALPNQLRVRPGRVVVGDPAGRDDVLRFRVQAAELWDSVAVEALTDDTLRSVKVNALHALAPSSLFPDDFFVNLRGATVLDESVTLAGAGVRDGTVILLARNRRRPVRA